MKRKTERTWKTEAKALCLCVRTLFG